jgi:hypothetical protein
MTDGDTPRKLTAFSQLGRYLLKPSVDQVTQPQKLPDRSLVGSKACGLLALPRSWTPPYLLLSAELHRDWLAKNKTYEIFREVGKEIVAYRNVWQGTWPRGLILRSSAVAETLRDRGAYKSYELPADFNPDSINTVVCQIYEAFEREGGDGLMAVIVQALAGGEIRGHVSNELRVAKSINHWMWEIEAPSSAADRFNSQRSRSPDLYAKFLMTIFVRPGAKEADALCWDDGSGSIINQGTFCPTLAVSATSQNHMIWIGRLIFRAI